MTGMTGTGRLVALVDDDDDLRAATAQLLSLAGFAVRPFAGAQPALAAIDATFAGVVVTDVRMPRMSGIELFGTLRARDADLPVVLMTGHGDIAMAVDALKAGAWDFLTKPFDPDVLIAAVTRAVTARALVLDNRRLREAAAGGPADELIGEAPAIRRLRAMIPMLSDVALDLVIEGETGTGKELLARLIHRSGPCVRHRFVAIDCATVPEAVVERELFVRNGIVARADRGTLFLDNLDRASPMLGDRLVRFAEARAVALDRSDPDPVDVRIVATIADGGQGAVPAALYHRLAGVPLRMPPLAERREDVPLLFSHLLLRIAERLGRPAPAVGDLPHRLAARAWPGNVRELERMAERVCLGIDEVGAEPSSASSLSARLDAFERDAIVAAIAAARGEIGEAIAALQLPRKTFYYRVKRLGIDLRALREAGK